MDDDVVAEERPLKGRGAISNESGRYENEKRAPAHDGWDIAEETPALETTILPDRSKSVIARNESPDVPFERSINPYRGCEHGCVYCFARPTHAFLGLSPGLDFESRIFAKHDGPMLLRQALAKPGYKPDVIALGANTDPYQPIERRLKITRGLLEVLLEARHPVGIVTKSAGILRDRDILEEMARLNLVRVAISVTTLDAQLARTMEPRAARPAKRLETLNALKAAGVPSSVLFAPVIPALNDHELESVLEAARDAGARAAGYVLLRLPLELKDLFEEWLAAHYPDRKARVLSRIKAMRGGRLYETGWDKRMRGGGPEADLLERRFDRACQRLGLNRAREKWDLDCSLFRRPAADPNQLGLFD